jgi:diguanylate cyclase (GGDEF)-like protein
MSEAAVELTGAALDNRAEVERLLEASLPRRTRRLPRRELTVEVSLPGIFLVAATVLALVGAAPLWASPMAFAMVVAYAIASRVAYPIATGVAVPTQPFLVGMFAFADARLVPLLALVGLTMGTIAACAAGRARWDRLSFGGGDVMHVLGPAVVLTALGYTHAGDAPWAIIGVAFAAQCAVEFITSTARDWITSSVRPQIQVLVLFQVWALDAALTPIGIMACATADITGLAWLPLTLLPLVAVVAHSARDRTERIDRLRLRLEDLQRERQRLQTAVKRIGDAFASRLDLDALVSILAGATLDALDAQAGRGTVVHGSGRPSFSTETSRELRPLLDSAEKQALERETVAEAHDESGWALAAPISPTGGPIAIVSVARAGAPFTRAEREVVEYLCLQAAVAAGDIARHKVLHRQAVTDALTGVANHRSFQELLEDVFKIRRTTGAAVSLLLLDLDDFKRVNDTYGHQTGDRVLSAVGQCLLRNCRLNDEPARYGGEEFAMVLPDTEMAAATQLAERLRSEIEALRFHGPTGEPVTVTTSIGVASAGQAAPDKTGLIAAADSALYQAKSEGKNRVSVAAQEAPAWAPRPRGQDDLPSQMRNGLEREEFVLHYQPKIDLPTGSMIGVEALLRWHHPELGLLGPSRFLPWAEGNDLMPAITEWVLDRALAQSVAWRKEGWRLPVAVNINAQDLADDEFPQKAARALRRAGARPDQLTLEITEHMAIATVDHVMGVLTDLRRTGITIAIDDFGTGHSSLTRLRDLPVDELKLDRDLLRQSPSSQDLAITRAAIALGRDLGLTVVAEGVEDAERLDFLVGMECDAAQGYYICPPLLPNELERWAGTDMLPSELDASGPTGRHTARLNGAARNGRVVPT